jgi:carnitine O-acetyltransferase
MCTTCCTYERVPEPPAPYSSTGWLTVRADILSTSSMPSSPHSLYGGFGPTSRRCTGIGYMVRPGRLDLHLSASLRTQDEMVVFAGKALPIRRRRCSQ